jgi:hypothetical protein
MRHAPPGLAFSVTPLPITMRLACRSLGSVGEYGTKVLLLAATSESLLRNSRNKNQVHVLEVFTSIYVVLPSHNGVIRFGEENPQAIRLSSNVLAVSAFFELTPFAVNSR